jgi:hypothetical protein
MRQPCFFVPKIPPCYVQLGRFGDIMIILPALYQHYQATGEKAVMLCCEEFASVLDGVSYVEPFPVSGIPWTNGVRRAMIAATKYYDVVVVPKWWDCHGMEPPPPPPNDPYVELDFQGRRLVVSPSEWDSYQYSQWKACGFSRQQLLDWPLVFDRRSAQREKDIAAHYLNPRKPNVLFNFTGTSNPMGMEPEVVRELQPLRDRINIVDIGRIRAHRIYDLLGLYDRSLCLITGDTSTLHLAAASKIPLIALLANGGAGSIVKGNEVFRLRYHEIEHRKHEIRTAVEKLL